MASAWIVTSNWRDLFRCSDEVGQEVEETSLGQAFFEKGALAFSLCVKHGLEQIFFKHPILGVLETCKFAHEWQAASAGHRYPAGP